jgi:hypothetical protein
MTRNSDTFVKITNKDIYDKLLVIEDHVTATNGKVKRSLWIGTTAMTLAILVIGLLFNHMQG